MKWANFLHIYQPPTQKEIWVRRITNESYRKIFSGLVNIIRTRLTVNINGILCELLDKYGGKDVLENMKKLVDDGRIELTGSAKYHAFLPLLPESEIERQIALNEETLNKYFGKSWKRGGFFSPEMAYARKVAKVAAKMGYKWIIMDELGLPAGKKLSPKSAVYKIKDVDDFSVFFRERNLSFTILSAQVGTVPTILRYLGPLVESDDYVVTAMDGETFGHHRPGLEILLFDLLKEEKIEPVMISDLLDKYPTEVIEPRDSTWAAAKKDMKENTPFSRWNSGDNIIQQKQWQLTNLAIEVANRPPVNKEVRELLDESLHSDQYWWASAKPWWSLEMIERGAHELKAVAQKSPLAAFFEKEKAEELYRDIVYTGFEWQRSGLVDELSRKEDEEIRERLEEKEKLFITQEEYRQMIKTLEEQMHLSAKAEEYHRAAMIKDRIRELKEEMEKGKA